jgi:hypothetical protein
MIEVVVNGKFFDPNNCDEQTRERAKDYLVCSFLEMANRKNPPEKKLVALNLYLHTNFPELFDIEEIINGR